MSSFPDDGNGVGNPFHLDTTNCSKGLHMQCKELELKGFWVVLIFTKEHVMYPIVAANSFLVI
jgi:hypothetical protein